MSSCRCEHSLTRQGENWRKLGAPTPVPNPATQDCKPNLAIDGFETIQLPSWLEPSFRKVQRDTYNQLQVGVGANNKLLRGIRWAILVNGACYWMDRDAYRLDAKFNQEEKGNVRHFSLLPDSFVRHAAFESVLNELLERWQFDTNSYSRAIEVQVSAIRYAPTFAEPALPAPVDPHQDQIDGAVIVLDESRHIIDEQLIFCHPREGGDPGFSGTHGFPPSRE